MLDRLKICWCAKFKAVDFNWIFLRVVKQISQVRWATASLPGFQKAPVLSGCPVGAPGQAPRWAVSARPAWAGPGGPCRGAAVCTEMGCLGHVAGWQDVRSRLGVDVGNSNQRCFLVLCKIQVSISARLPVCGSPRRHRRKGYSAPRSTLTVLPMFV